MSPKNLPLPFEKTSVQSLSAKSAHSDQVDNTATICTLHPDHYTLEGYVPWLYAFNVRAHAHGQGLSYHIGNEANTHNSPEEILIDHFLPYSGCAMVVESSKTEINHLIKKLYDQSVRHLEGKLPHLYHQPYDEFLAVWDLSIYNENHYLISIASRGSDSGCYGQLINNIKKDSSLVMKNCIESLVFSFTLKVFQPLEKETYAQQLLIHTEKDLLNLHIANPPANHASRQNKKI